MSWLYLGMSGSPGEGGGDYTYLLFMVFIFAMFYLLLIRPQVKRQRELTNLREALKNGDEVVLSSGILGTVVGIEDQYIWLRIADKVKVKVLKAAVEGRQSTTVESNSDS
jgi:preprotein translocase subunit YajC